MNAASRSLVLFGTGVDSSKQSVASTESLPGSHQHRAQITRQSFSSRNLGAVFLVIIFFCLPVTLFGRTISVVNWNTPAAITYGTALTSTQLNATATIPGTFAYSPAAGAILGAGSRTLSVTFTPTDTTDYSIVTVTATLTVNKATPRIAWATPGAIDSGTELSSKQLDATASVPGTFAYSPAAGSLFEGGTHTLAAIFTPTDSANFNDASASVSLTVYKGLSKLSINSSSVSFGNVELSQPATQTLTLSSTGSASVTVKSAAISGAGFTLSGPTLPVTLATGQAVTLGVEFDPTVVGAASGTLTVNSTSSSNGKATVALSGTGAAVSYAVDLSWDAPSESAVPVAGYNVYRAPSGSSSYQLLTPSVDVQTSYVDNTVQAGASYDYEIESVDSSGVASAPTTPVAVAVP
jgi:hypothetical protein